MGNSQQYRVRKTENALGEDVYAVERKGWLFWAVQRNALGDVHAYRDKEAADNMMVFLASREEVALMEEKRNTIK
jgi:hypothetical protein